MQLVLESGLPQDAVKCTRRNIILEMPSNGYPSWFSGMFVLAMAALLGDHDPAIALYYTQNFSNSHELQILRSINDTLSRRTNSKLSRLPAEG